MEKNQMGRVGYTPKLTATLSLGVARSSLKVATADVFTAASGFYQLTMKKVSGRLRALAIPMKRSAGRSRADFRVRATSSPCLLKVFCE